MASRIPSAASRIALTSRTVYVGNRSVMAAYTSIQRIMNRSGLIQKVSAYCVLTGSWCALSRLFNIREYRLDCIPTYVWL